MEQRRALYGRMNSTGYKYMKSSNLVATGVERIILFGSYFQFHIAKFSAPDSERTEQSREIVSTVNTVMLRMANTHLCPSGG